MYARTHRETERERERQTESRSKTRRRGQPQRLGLFSLPFPFASRRSRSVSPFGSATSLSYPFARPTFHVSLTKAHATIYSHFAPQPRGDFSSFCHNFGIIKIYGYPYHGRAGPYVFSIPTNCC